MSAASILTNKICLDHMMTDELRVLRELLIDYVRRFGLTDEARAYFAEYSGQSTETPANPKVILSSESSRNSLAINK